MGEKLMRILTIAACLLIAACNANYDDVAVKTIPAQERLDEWNKTTDDPYIDRWARPHIDEWMRRQMTDPVENREFDIFRDLDAARDAFWQQRFDGR